MRISQVSLRQLFFWVFYGEGCSWTICLVCFLNLKTDAYHNHWSAVLRRRPWVLMSVFLPFIFSQFARFSFFSSLGFVVHYLWCLPAALLVPPMRQKFGGLSKVVSFSTSTAPVAVFFSVSADLATNSSFSCFHSYPVLNFVASRCSHFLRGGSGPPYVERHWNDDSFDTWVLHKIRLFSVNTMCSTSHIVVCTCSLCWALNNIFLIKLLFPETKRSFIRLNQLVCPAHYSNPQLSGTGFVFNVQ